MTRLGLASFDSSSFWHFRLFRLFVLFVFLAFLRMFHLSNFAFVLFLLTLILRFIFVFDGSFISLIFFLLGSFWLIICNLNWKSNQIKSPAAATRGGDAKRNFPLSAFFSAFSSPSTLAEIGKAEALFGFG